MSITPQNGWFENLHDEVRRVQGNEPSPTKKNEDAQPDSLDLVPVFAAPDEVEARLVQDLLEDSGIQTGLRGQGFVVLWGPCEILVFESQAAEARRIVAEYLETKPLPEPQPELKVPKEPDLPEHIAEWTLEPELAGPVPRAISPRRLDYYSRIFILPSVFVSAFFHGKADRADLLTFMIVAAFVSLCVTEWQRRVSRTLVEKGIATRGIVLERNAVVVRRSVYWRHVVGYETPVLLKIHSMLGHRQVGDTLTVLYLPDAPERAMPYERCLYKAVPPGK